MNEKKNFCENVLFFGEKFPEIRSKVSRNSFETFAKFVRNICEIRSKLSRNSFEILLDEKWKDFHFNRTKILRRWKIFAKCIEIRENFEQKLTNFVRSFSRISFNENFDGNPNKVPRPVDTKKMKTGLSSASQNYFFGPFIFHGIKQKSLFSEQSRKM